MESGWGSTGDAAHVGRRHGGRAGTANVPTIQCEARRVALRALALLPTAALALALGHTVAALRLGQTATDLRPKETTRSNTPAQSNATQRSDRTGPVGRDSVTVLCRSHFSGTKWTCGSRVAVEADSTFGVPPVLRDSDSVGPSYA